MRGTLHDRLMARVNKNGPIPEYAPHLGPCWIFTGAIDKRDGYGKISLGRRCDGREATHRVSYKLFKGPIPDGLELDHLCRNRACCNPDHCEPVTRRENQLRGNTIPARNIKKTHCPYGHPFATDGSYSYKNGRMCPQCTRERRNKAYRNKKTEPLTNT